MNWKEQLLKFEQSKDWRSAIDLLQTIIRENSSSIDAYLSMNYLLMNLLVEEDYNSDEYDYYTNLLKKYFVESYAKFSQIPEYLFFIGKIACISEWYFDIKFEEAQRMMKKAAVLEPENVLYRWAIYSDFDMRDSGNKEKVMLYAKEALRDETVTGVLNAKGSLGKYLEDTLTFWANDDVSK